MALPSPPPAAFRLRCCGLQDLEIFQRNLARLQKIRDQQPGRSAEQLQQIPDEPHSVLVLIDGRLEYLSVADLLHFAKGALLLQPVDESLYSRVGHLFIFGQALQHFAHRAGSKFPALFHDPGLGLRQTDSLHGSPTDSSNPTTKDVAFASASILPRNKPATRVWITALLPWFGPEFIPYAKQNCHNSRWEGGLTPLVLKLDV